MRKKPRIGRPPLPQEERRCRMMTVKLTPGEYQELAARAAQHSLTMSDYVVWRCLDSLRDSSGNEAE